MDTEKDTQATEGDDKAEDTEGQTWNPLHSAVPEDDKAEDTEGQTFNPGRQ